MKKILATLLLFLILLTEATLQAVPARRIVRTRTQPDGTILSTILQGDENFHYMTTTDGIMLQEATDGFIKYATITTQGTLSAGEYVAHDPEKRTEHEIAYIKEINNKQINDAIQNIRSKNLTPPWMVTPKKMKFPNQGTVRGLIILAQYKDVKFTPANTPQRFSDMMNTKGYSDNGATGSARDYFMDQSNGIFTPEFDIVGPVTLPENMSYYGGNSALGKDINPAKMTVDACYAADTLLNVDFSQYDFDNDGKVDLVYVIYAGYAEAQGGPSASIWPHAWNLEYAGFTNVKLDGKLVRSYACSSELHGDKGTTMDGIGTFCHEFSHCLGLPDIYDTRSTGMVGMNDWSIMDHGCYNNEAKTPSGYSAYERYYIGWLTPIALKEPRKGIELLPINTTNQAYMIVSDKNPDEYYTIENRQPSGWDAYLPGHGMMIVHVDYVPAIWESNIVNSSAAGHPHLQIVPADNEFRNFGGDAFPGTSVNTAFTDESLPAATLYTGGFISKPINRIQEKEDVITFDYMHFIGTPVATQATEITDNTFTANWNPVNNASFYTLNISASMSGKECVGETFSYFAKGNSTEPDGQDIANTLDTYMEIPGWSGTNIYQAGEHCRMGNATSGGSLITPILDFSKEKEFTLCCRVKGSKNLITGYKFELSDENGNSLLSKSLLMETPEKTLYWIFSTEARSGRISVKTEASAVFDYIKIYNGDVKEQLEKGEVPSVPREYANEITNITSNAYTVTGLENEKRYIYNVYASLNEEISGLSNKIVLQTQKPTGVEKVSATPQIHTQPGLLRIITDRRTEISIYTPGGTIVYAGPGKEGRNEITLPKGFYILTIGTERFKVHIP